MVESFRYVMLGDVCSDLHVDCYKINDDLFKTHKNPNSQFLIIGGDTSNEPWITNKQILRASETYDHVIVILGNHEYYCKMPFVEVLSSVKDIVERCNLPNVSVLDNESVQLGTVAFIGATGWYDFKPGQHSGTLDQIEIAWSKVNNDSKLIKWDLRDYQTKFDCVLSKAKESFEYIKGAVAKANQDPLVESIVISTHMIPNVLLAYVKAYDPVWNALNGSFINSLMEDVVHADVNKKIKLWTYGHTHIPNDTKIGHIRYVCNPGGYPSERSQHGFKFVQVQI